MTRFYIQYQSYAVVSLLMPSVLQGEETVVGDLVAAYKTTVAPFLVNTSVAQLALHLPEKVSRSTLTDDCFAPTDSAGTTLDSGCLLSSLGSLGSDSKQPLIITLMNGTSEEKEKLLLQADSAKELELCTIKPDFQNKAWKSTVQIHFVDRRSSTAIIVDMDDDSLYLLLNIHTLDDVILLKFVSTDFRKEINIYEPKKDHSKRPRNNQKIFDDAGFGETPKFTSEVDKSIHLDPQKVEILALNTSSRKLELVLDFYLKAECCLKASASSDYAILKVPCGKNQTTGLQKCQLGLNAATYSIYDSMSVQVFGFPSALSEFQHDYTVNLSSISGSDSEGCMVITGLSSPGLSGSAIVCTVQGWPIGYLGGEVTSGESKVHQYQAYGYALFGIMSVLKDILPRFKRPKIQKGDQE